MEMRPAMTPRHARVASTLLGNLRSNAFGKKGLHMLTKRLTLALWTLMAAPFYCAVVQPLAAAQLVVPFNYFWAYQDSGNDPGPDWFTPEFNHSSWKFGLSRFGYGNFNEQTEVNSAANTVYFRTTFSGTANTYSNLSLLLLRDDGAVVYLNGVEVLRNNLPEGASHSRDARASQPG
jgi:hypothetical protein